MATYTTKFHIEQIVYHRLDPEEPGFVTGILIRPGSRLLYYVTWQDLEEASHYEFELTDEKGFVKA